MRANGQQSIDKKTIAAWCRDAPGGCVRTGDESQFFQIRHDVANRGGGEFKAGKFRQRARAYWLAVADIAFDQKFQQDLRAFVQHSLILTNSSRL